jgi:hypothetical protein
MHSKELEHYKKGLKLTTRQREIIIGTLLGDAHLENRYKSRIFSLMIEHSIKQKEYVDWLYNEFKEWVRTPPKIKYSTVNGKKYQKYYFRTLSSGRFRFYHHQFYKQGKKIVPKLIHKWLTPLGLAVWFMDDGSLKSKHHRARIINTQGFSKKENKHLIEVLFKNFKVKSKLRKQKEGYQIYVLAETVSIFKDIINPYIISSMHYKLKGLN